MRAYGNMAISFSFPWHSRGHTQTHTHIPVSMVMASTYRWASLFKRVQNQHGGFPQLHSSVCPSRHRWLLTSSLVPTLHTQRDEISHTMMEIPHMSPNTHKYTHVAKDTYCIYWGGGLTKNFLKSISCGQIISHLHSHTTSKQKPTSPFTNKSGEIPFSCPY